MKKDMMTKNAVRMLFVAAILVFIAAIISAPINWMFFSLAIFYFIIAIVNWQQINAQNKAKHHIKNNDEPLGQ